MVQNENEYLRRKAWEFILEYRLARLPVDHFALAQHVGAEPISYKSLTAVVGIDMLHLLKINLDGFVFYSPDTCRYMIAYNSAQQSCIIRWTVMHEVAHIVLGHITHNAYMTRVRFIDHTRAEREADGFARRVICPSIVLHDCKAIDPPEIMQLCGVSYKAAQYRSRLMYQLEARNKWRTNPLEVLVERQFMPFIKEHVRNNIKLKILRRPVAAVG